MATTMTTSWQQRGGAPSGRRLDGLLAGLLLLLLAAAAALVFLATVQLIDPGQLIVGEHALTAAADAQGWERAAVLIGSLAVGLLAAGAFTARLLSPSRSNSHGVGAAHVVSADDQGLVLVDTDGVCAVAEAAAVRAAGVVGADVRVKGKGSEPVRLGITAYVIGGSDLKRAGAEAQKAARDAVERLAGLQVRDVNVEVKVLSSDAYERGLE